jgi:hypothetical protein
MPDQFREGGIGEVKAEAYHPGLFPGHVRRRIPFVHCGADQLSEAAGQAVNGGRGEHGRQQ